MSLLHARRPSVAFDILVEVFTTVPQCKADIVAKIIAILPPQVVGAHYLDPHVWFHLAECCLMAGQPDNSHHFSSTASQAREVAEGGAGDAYAINLRWSQICFLKFHFDIPSDPIDPRIWAASDNCSWEQ